MLNLKSNYLKLYVGCMFSGKSTSLLNEMIKYKVITDKIIMINHIYDKKRYTEDQKKPSKLLLKRVVGSYNHQQVPGTWMK